MLQPRGVDNETTRFLQDNCPIDGALAALRECAVGFPENPRVGWLVPTTTTEQENLEEYRRGMRELGYLEVPSELLARTDDVIE